jgi:hypothetical protein
VAWPDWDSVQHAVLSVRRLPPGRVWLAEIYPEMLADLEQQLNATIPILEQHAR